MAFLFTAFLVLYLLFGIVYSLYVWLFKADPFYMIPVNALFWPAAFIVTGIHLHRARNRNL